MKSFEEKKQEYMECLRQNTFILSNIKTDNPDIVGIILDPKTERELLIAQSIITFTTDSIDLMENLSDIKVSDEDFENSISINLFVSIIYALKENDKAEIERIKNYLSTNIDPEYAARMMYDFIIVFGCDMQRSIDEIAKRSGFDLEDELSRLQFINYLAKANEINNSNKKKDFDLSNNDLVDSSIKMINIFHEIYESKKKKKDNSIRELTKHS